MELNNPESASVNSFEMNEENSEVISVSSINLNKDCSVADESLNDVDIAEEVEEYGDTSIYTAEEIQKEVNLVNNVNSNAVPLDANLLAKLEIEANRIATSVDGLTENLTGLLHSISALTSECLNTYGNAICKTCDAVDHNIKQMYQLMAKCEEVNKVAMPVVNLHRHVKDIRHVIDLLENVTNL